MDKTEIQKNMSYSIDSLIKRVIKLETKLLMMENDKNVLELVNNRLHSDTRKEKENDNRRKIRKGITLLIWNRWR